MKGAKQATTDVKMAYPIRLSSARLRKVGAAVRTTAFVRKSVAMQRNSAEEMSIPSFGLQ